MTETAKGRTTVLPRAIIAALLVLACEGSEHDAKDSGPPGGPKEDAPPGDTGFASDSAGDHVMLARSMTSRWTTRELRHTPKYLQLVGWRSRDTIVALAGENPVEIDVRTSAFTAWNRRALGAQLASDGRRLAWAHDGYWVGERGSPPRLVLPYERVEAAGDPSGAIHWSPDGRRIATWWVDEASVTYVIIDLERDTARTLETGLPRAMWGSTALWLDTARLLLAVTALHSKGGAPDYKESGHRGELAVCDLSGGSCSLVTDVEDGIFLQPETRWGPRGVLVRERRSGQHVSSFFVYDVESWDRRPIALPAGRVVAVTSDALLAVTVDPRAHPFPSDVSPTDTTLLVLWEAGPDVARPLARVAGGDVQLSWFASGDRLAILSAEILPAPPPQGHRSRRRLTILDRR